MWLFFTVSIFTFIILVVLPLLSTNGWSVPLIGLIIWIILGVSFGYKSFGTEGTTTIKVERLERTGGDYGKYLVWTDNGVYENTDAWYHGKTDSSDLYGELEVGRTYHCEYNGFRFSLLSWYRNLLDCESA